MPDAVSQIKKLIDSSKIIDLSHPLNDKVPALFGQPPFEMAPVVTTESGSPFVHSKISMSEHSATHMDAPCHFLYDKDVSALPLETFFGRAATLIFLDQDVITKEDIVEWESEHGSIQQGDIVLFGFGWEDKFYDKAFYESWPGLSEEAAKYLAAKQIKAVGVDTLTVDASSDIEYTAHHAVLSQGIIIYENLKNLKLLPAFSYFIGMPLKVEGATGTPIRAVAIV